MQKSELLKRDKQSFVRTSTYEAEPGQIKKVVLLYSGGLDTSVIVPWLKDNFDVEVITLTIDLGQPIMDLEAIKQKALKCGASEAYVIDAKDEFADNYVAKAIKANGLYEGGYPLSTAIGRPLLAKLAVKLANKVGADAVAHGSTGKGNDQARFDAGIITLDPKMKVIAPIRDWNMTRDEEYEYAEQHGIPLPNTKKSPYSCDENLWGKSSECGVLEDPNHEPPRDVFQLVTVPEEAPDKPEYITFEFEKGIPTALNGEKMPLKDLIMKVMKIAGKHGVGIIDMTEDRVVGLKSREIYECPAAITILAAHKDLEKFVCTIDENQFKEAVDTRWAYSAYNALWYDPVMDALNAFIDKINERVTGTVRMKLYKGSASVVGRTSPYALYDFKLASYDKGHTFNTKASPGFIELWSLQSKMARNLIMKNKK